MDPDRGKRPLVRPGDPPRFDFAHHIRSLAAGEWLDCVDEQGARLPGVRGREGARGELEDGSGFGIDMIEMASGASFAPHVHQGAHVLYVLSGSGTLTIGGSKNDLVPNTTVFVPADLPHAVSALENGDSELLVFLAVGYPHQRVDSTTRMRTVATA